jgi:hypothetical protein
MLLSPAYALSSYRTFPLSHLQSAFHYSQIHERQLALVLGQVQAKRQGTRQKCPDGSLTTAFADLGLWRYGDNSYGQSYYPFLFTILTALSSPTASM